MSFEDRHERFKRVGALRTERVLAAIRSLKKCSSKNYAFTEEEVSKMFGVINNEIKMAKANFVTKNNNEKFKF